MKLFQIGLIVLSVLSLVSLSQAYLYYGQQSINSDYYFRGAYYSPTYTYQSVPSWNYYSYNTFDPYPTLGGGLYYPPVGSTYTYGYPAYGTGYNAYSAFNSYNYVVPSYGYAYPGYGYGAAYDSGCGYNDCGSSYGASYYNYGYSSGFCLFWC